MTAATSSRWRSRSSRRWVRARITSCTVSGTATWSRLAVRLTVPSPARCTAPTSSSERTSSSMKNGLPSALSSTSVCSARREIGGAQQTAGDAQALLAGQRRQRERGVEAPAAERRPIARSVRQDQQQALGGESPGQPDGPVLGGRIGPVHVLDHDHVRAQLRAPLHQAVGGADDRGVPPLGVHGGQRRVAGVDRQQVADDRNGLAVLHPDALARALDLLDDHRLRVGVVDATHPPRSCR